MIFCIYWNSTVRIFKYFKIMIIFWVPTYKKIVKLNIEMDGLLRLVLGKSYMEMIKNKMWQNLEWMKYQMILSIKLCSLTL